jgi:hypothetical protein
MGLVSALDEGFRVMLVRDARLTKALNASRS